MVISKKCLIGSVVAFILAVSANAEDIHFSKVASYTWEGASVPGDTFYMNGELEIGERGGLLSRNPLQGDFDITVRVKPSFGSAKYTSGEKKGVTWNENLVFGLYASPINNNTTLSKPNMDFIQLRIKSCSALESGDFDKNTIHGNLNNKDLVNIDNDVCMTPKEYNDIRIIKGDKSIKILVNDKEAISYQGQMLENGYLGIGTNTPLPFSMDRKIEMNPKTIVLDK